jgi:regulator of sigma E protease
MQILIGLIAISVIMLIHELGHFIAAKACNIKVREFSIFMGPKLFQFKRGETLYTFRLIPMGAFVAMEGEEEDSKDERAYCNKPVWQRAIVAFAGSFANITVALLIFTLIFFSTGYVTNEIGLVEENSGAYQAGLQEGDIIKEYNGKKIRHALDLNVYMYALNDKPITVLYERDGQKYTASFKAVYYPESKRYLLGFVPLAESGPDSNVVGSVNTDTDARRSGLLSGDRIIEINGNIIKSRQDIAAVMEKFQGGETEVKVEREGKIVTLYIKPYLESVPEMYLPGFYFKSAKGGFFRTIGNAWRYTFSNVRSVYLSLGWLISGKVSLKNMMGPVGIISTIGSVTKQPTVRIALQSSLNVIAVISVNLGVMNLLPIPALDGSKLIILFIERLRRKPIPPEREAMISLIGFVLLISLMVFTVYNDIIRLLGN